LSLPYPERFATFDLTLCGIDELAAQRDRNVTHILSLLDPGSPVPEAFAHLAGPNRLDLRFHDVIDPGRGWRAPEVEDVDRLLAFGRDIPDDGGHLLVHCQMGISRSSAAVLLLLAQARPDRQADALLAEVVRIRPHAWPNLRIVELGDARLGRRGALVEAAHARYREVVAKRPEIGRAMLQMGRKREVERAFSAD
jgi:predicted protein tyrosine phosphatase